MFGASRICLVSCVVWAEVRILSVDRSVAPSLFGMIWSDFAVSCQSAVCCGLLWSW